MLIFNVLQSEMSIESLTNAQLRVALTRIRDNLILRETSNSTTGIIGKVSIL